MPNNLVFNNVASELKTQIFGVNGGNTVAVAVNTDGSLIIGTVTAIISEGTVEVSGGTIDMVSALEAGTVTVQGGTIDLVSALEAGTVTVQGGTIQTTPVFFSSDTAIAVGTSSVDALLIETATQKLYSFYVANIAGVNTITAVLMISPTNANATYFVNDSSTQYTIGPTGAVVMIPEKFLRYTKLQLIASASTTALCYFDGQS